MTDRVINLSINDPSLRSQRLYVLFFDEPSADDASLCGGKAASLGRLAATAAVPPGFCVTVNAYRRWEEAGSSEIPSELADEIRSAYWRLEEKAGAQGLPVAVRSSAVDEDGAGDSFAGLHDTYLNVQGADHVLESVVKCWRSLKNDRAIEYREARGLDVESAVMGVAVQQLVFADSSAVAFSANPITGDLGEVVINANFGLGEAVVSGATTPDTIIVSKSDFTHQTLSIGAKEVMTVRTENGTEERNTPRIMRDQPALSPDQVSTIARLATDLEAHHGSPVDIECAIQGGELYLLQCRPITTL